MSEELLRGWRERDTQYHPAVCTLSTTRKRERREREARGRKRRETTGYEPFEREEAHHPENEGRLDHAVRVQPFPTKVTTQLGHTSICVV